MYYNMNLDFKQKLYNSVLGGIVFFVVSLPQLYATSNDLLSSSGSCPTYKSKLVHALIFFILLMILMKYMKPDTMLVIAKYAFLGSLLFFLISSSEMYNLTNNFISSSENGCPNMTGIMIHTVLYIVSLTGTLYMLK